MWGNSIAAFAAIAYSIFHLESAQRSLEEDNSEASANAVAAIIDSYNRYSGFCGFVIIIVASLMVQEKIVRTIRLLERVDFVLEQHYALDVGNNVWMMYARQPCSLQLPTIKRF